MAKVLLSDDSVLLNKIVGDLQQFNCLLERLKAQYEALGLGNLTDEVFKALLVNLAHPLIPNPTPGQAAAIVDLNETIRTLIAFKPEIKDNYRRPNDVVLELRYITYIDGTFVVSDTESISEKYTRVYVDSDAQTALSNNLSLLITQINNLKANAISLGLSTQGIVDPQAVGLISKFIKVNQNGSISINEDAVNWALTFKNASN